MEKKIHLGYRYKLKISDGQKSFLDHHMFIYNQAYNICLNLWLKENEKNKNLPKKLKQYRSATGYDTVVKRALRFRKLTFSTVVTQQARINFLKAVKRAFSKEIVSARLKAIETAQTLKEKVKANQLGMPTFKSSRDTFQSFNWHNQGFQIINDKNPKFKVIKLMKVYFRYRYCREMSTHYKITSITFSKDFTGYYVSYGVELKKQVDLVVSSDTFDITKSIGIDLNAYNIAVSNNVDFIKESNISDVKLGHLIDNGATNRRALKYKSNVVVLLRKQSRRVLKALEKSKIDKTKLKLGNNHRKTQSRINKLNKKIANQRNDLYHKISTALTNKFDMIVVEDLKTIPINIYS